MGTCSSKKLNLSIDMKGNNNYAVLMNGVQVNMSSVFHEIMNQINRENRTVLTIFCLTCIFVMLVLIIVVMSVLDHKRNRSRQSYVMIRNIEHEMKYMTRTIEYLTMLLKTKEIKWRSENLCLDKTPQCSV